MEDYGRDISLHFAVDSWAFFLFVELSEKHGDPFYEEGSRSLMLKPLCNRMGARHQRKYSFSGAKSAD